MQIMCSNLKVGSMPTSSCIFFIFTYPPTRLLAVISKLNTEKTCNGLTVRPSSYWFALGSANAALFLFWSSSGPSLRSLSPLWVKTVFGDLGLGRVRPWLHCTVKKSIKQDRLLFWLLVSFTSYIRIKDSRHVGLFWMSAFLGNNPCFNLLRV